MERTRGMSDLRHDMCSSDGGLRLFPRSVLVEGYTLANDDV